MYPTIQPSDVKNAERQAFWILLYSTAHCRMATIVPDMMTGYPAEEQTPKHPTHGGCHDPVKPECLFELT